MEWEQFRHWGMLIWKADTIGPGYLDRVEIRCGNDFVQWSCQLWRQFWLFIQSLGFSVIIQSLSREEIVDYSHTIMLTFKQKNRKVVILSLNTRVCLVFMTWLLAFGVNMQNVFILWENSRKGEENISENICKQLKQRDRLPKKKKKVLNLKTILKLFYKNYDSNISSSTLTPMILMFPPMTHRYIYM